MGEGWVGEASALNADHVGGAARMKTRGRRRRVSSTSSFIISARNLQGKNPSPRAIFQESFYHPHACRKIENVHLGFFGYLPTSLDCEPSSLVSYYGLASFAMPQEMPNAKFSVNSCLIEQRYLT